MTQANTDTPTVLGIIPARGGSKGLPRKNLRLLMGKPLIAWTIDVALGAQCLDRVVVSTDDEEIADVARRHGGEVPFRRPRELAADATPGIEPVLHAIHWLDEQERYRADSVLLLQPTSPFRTEEDIHAALKIAQEHAADAVVSVCPVSYHPYWMKRVDSDGRVSDFLSGGWLDLRRQELPPVYALNGAIYLARAQVLLTQRSFYTDQTYAYVMPTERSMDIDEEWDFHVAELLLQERMTHARD